MSIIHSLLHVWTRHEDKEKEKEKFNRVEVFSIIWHAESPSAQVGRHFLDTQDAVFILDTPSSFFSDLGFFGWLTNQVSCADLVLFTFFSVSYKQIRCFFQLPDITCQSPMSSWNIDSLLKRKGRQKPISAQLAYLLDSFSYCISVDVGFFPFSCELYYFTN